MTTLTLRLESDTESLDLNRILKQGHGVQAVVGATGFGMPQVETQWNTGAGDGSAFRGSRIQARDIDLPIYVVGVDRAHLIKLYDIVVRILSGPANLVLEDGKDSWVLAVRRIGGGDYTMGQDSDGDSFLQTTVTLRAGQPYWVARFPTKFTEIISDAAFKSDRMRLNNTGTAPAYSTWTFRGPATRFKIEAGDLRFAWEGRLARGDYIVVDTENGTVTDKSGDSRYHGLQPAPRFRPLAPGITRAYVEFDNPPDVSIATRTNYVVDPFVRTNLIGAWTTSDSRVVKGDNTTPGLLFQPTWRQTTNASTTPMRFSPHSAEPATITGLTIGRTYTVGCYMETDWSFASVDSAPPESYIATPTYPLVGASITLLSGGTAPVLRWPVNTSGPVYQSMSFKATATSATFRVKGAYCYFQPRDSASGFEEGVFTFKTYAREFFLGEAGGAFTGDTPDTEEVDYSWITSVNGKSQAASAPVTKPNMICTLRPRKLAVI